MKKLLPNLLLMLVTGIIFYTFKDNFPTQLDSRFFLLLVLILAAINVFMLQRENNKLKAEILELKK
ncbi:MAG: hypothetical protein EOP04_03195 [Proteobacteria bacterium]|nr:MAG: hypothetical protein EOP04_03195 [Pseudomonadota bacterium]